MGYQIKSVKIVKTNNILHMYIFLLKMQDIKLHLWYHINLYKQIHKLGGKHIKY